MQNLSVVPEGSQNPLWMNGEIVPWNDAKVHIFTHAFNYGTSVFEGIRVYETADGPAIFHLDEHLDRLDRSMKSFHIESPYSREELVEAHKEVVRQSGHSSGYLRPQVGFGVSSRVSLQAIDVTDVTIFFQPLGQYRATKELKVILSDIERISPKAGDIEAKVSGFYTNGHYNHFLAHSKNADDAIMLDVDGNVAEASSANVFIVKDGVLQTPKTGFILQGITRKSVMELAAKELGLTVVETVLTPADLETADEIFLTGTAAEIDPVVEYNGSTVGAGGVGAVTQKISELYSKTTRGEVAGYEHWLTAVK